MKIESNRLENGWKEFNLINDNGMSVSILNYGGIITKIMVPDKTGKVENIVLGYEDYQDYKKDSNFYGAIIGRDAGRIYGVSFNLVINTYPTEMNTSE